MIEWKEIEFGKIPIEWQCIPIGETDLQIGDGNYSSKYPKQEELLTNGIPFISSNDLTNGRITKENLRYVSPELHSKLLKGHVKCNDVIIVVRGNGVGQVALVDKNYENANLNAQLAYLGRSKNINGKYLYYLMLYYFKSGITGTKVTGSAQPQITIGTLRTLGLILPSSNEQERIAEVLSSLDDKIDLLHRQNKTLEQMAETLFRQWFVEEENEKIILKDAIKTTSGGTPSRANSTYYNGTIPWVKSKELNNNFILKTEEHITLEGLNKSSAKLLKPFTVMIAMYGATIGEIGIIEKSATCNQAICAIEQTKEYPYTFLDQFFKSIKTDLINLAVGGAQQNISQDLIKTLELPAPSAKIIKYNEIVSPFYNKLLENVKQIQKLTDLRDLLLPKLMNGSIRVINN